MQLRVKRLLATALSLVALTAPGLLATSTPAHAASPPAWTFKIQNFHNGKCLDVLGFNNNNGAGVGLWDCWPGANQLWYWDANLEAIRSYMNGKCLEILSFNYTNGAQVGMWDCWGGANQRWTYPNVNGNWTTIRSKLHWKCVELLHFDNRNGAWAGMWDCVNGPNQYWAVYYPHY